MSQHLYDNHGQFDFLEQPLKGATGIVVFVINGTYTRRPSVHCRRSSPLPPQMPPSIPSSTSLSAAILRPLPGHQHQGSTWMRYGKGTLVAVASVILPLESSRSYEK